MKNDLKRADSMSRSSVMEAVSACVEPMTMEGSFLTNPLALPILRTSRLAAKKSTRPRKNHPRARRTRKKPVICPASVAMCEAVALDEIGNFLDMLIPDARHVGKKWNEVVDPIALTRIPFL